MSRQPSIEWGPAAAAHLLRRAQFGVHPTELNQAVADGLEATVERLLSPQPESTSFQAADAALRQTALATGVGNDLKAWWLHRMLRSANPLTEKLTLFWHNHFATSLAKVHSIRQMAAQNDLFRQHAVGDFRRLLHAAARDPAMLVWLDGNANRRRHPNENFAREVMELFCLGRGNYTEKDIQEAARAFSGWHLRDGEFWLNASQHDSGEKTVFGQTGAYTGSEIIDLCLEHPASTRFIATKLLRTFVSPEPAADLVETVSASLKQHQWRMRPVLWELFTAPQFFAVDVRGAIIKSPLDYVIGTLRAVTDRVQWPAVMELLAELGQNVFEPPSVKGWDGGRQWLHATAVIQRLNFVTALVGDEHYGSVRQDLLVGAADPLKEWSFWLLGGSAQPEVTAQLARVWTEAGGDAAARSRSLLHAFLSLPEYQLM